MRFVVLQLCLRGQKALALAHRRTGLVGNRRVGGQPAAGVRAAEGVWVAASRAVAFENKLLLLLLWLLLLLLLRDGLKVHYRQGSLSSRTSSAI